ncbi:NFATC2-interacting protein-like isoform X2 [Acanthaster planci]|uniref:NFATC2-interacting protein-like isoform X2 n=1 Tax=Acanthaster planci TaxID=133434 RepID=A0A8B7Z973_ACAPL|nr:NFATC2-interacting protein-like isoform X2 [Acanthaster planci]
MSEEENTPKLRPAATKKKHYTHPVGEVKCRIYSNAAQNLALPEIDENIADSDEDEDLYDEPVSKKKRQPYKKTSRKKKSNNPVYLDSDEEDISCYGTPKKAPSVSSLDSPCSPPPPLDLASQLMQYDQETSKVLRSINVALTNVRCIQSEVSSQSDDGFSPARRIPGGTIAVIDVDSPPAPRIRSTITVKVRSRAGIKRFPLQMTDTFSSIIDEIASQEGVRRDCVRLTRNGQDVGEFDTPHSMELHIADIIDCLIVEPECLIAAPEQRVEVTIQGQEKKSTMTTTILWSDSLQKLMAEYSTFCGRPQHKIRFTFDGDVIKPTDTPTSLDFEEDTNTIDAIFI